MGGQVTDREGNSQDDENCQSQSDLSDHANTGFCSDHLESSYASVRLGNNTRVNTPREPIPSTQSESKKKDDVNHHRSPSPVPHTESNRSVDLDKSDNTHTLPTGHKGASDQVHLRNVTPDISNTEPTPPISDKE